MCNEHVKESSEKYRLQISIVNIHTLHQYAMLFYVMHRAVSDHISLAGFLQPNGYDDQTDLVDPFEGYELDTPTTHGHPKHGPNYRLAHNHDHSHDHALESRGLSI